MGIKTSTGQDLADFARSTSIRQPDLSTPAERQAADDSHSSDLQTRINGQMHEFLPKKDGAK